MKVTISRFDNRTHLRFFFLTQRRLQGDSYWRSTLEEAGKYSELHSNHLAIIYLITIVSPTVVFPVAESGGGSHHRLGFV